MALRDSIIRTEIQDLIKAFKENPQDEMKIIEEYSGAVNKRVALEFRKFYASVFMKLYSYDCEALKLDITKYAVLQPQKIPTKKERTELLVCLLNSLPSYFANDYSIILNEAERIIETRESLDAEDKYLPFV